MLLVKPFADTKVPKMLLGFYNNVCMGQTTVVATY